MHVSVVATVLNERQDIEGLVQSLMQQSLVPAQVVIVDGGSTDGTWEWLESVRQAYPKLVAIRDESCSLRFSPGPIARGRNVAITAAAAEIVACADCGCIYAPDWLQNLTSALAEGRAEYSVGGSWIDPNDPAATVWDIASAPFFGVKLSLDEPTKSCTARSMAFRTSLWQRVGGFPETVLLGEDTLFDAAARRTVAPVFAARAKALYRPRQSFSSALHQLSSYAIADGVLGVRPARLLRNLLRSLAMVVVLLLLRVTPIPFLVDLALEVYWAFRLDWRQISKTPIGTMAARLVFSLLVPWVVFWNQMRGSRTKQHQPNRQNA